MYPKVLKVVLFLAIASSVGQCKPTNKDAQDLVSNFFNSKEFDENKSTRWAVLVAGSSEWYNYRHQADVCHAYHLLKQGGLKDENIIVFMYDDIAHNHQNPYPGKILNRPNGTDVYQGVPKDFTGEAVNAKNLYAVISGDKSALTGANSGKVLDTKPEDHIFIFYSDHGGPGVLGMPDLRDMVYAKDLVEVLKKKHEANGYRQLLFYLEACESGSIFQGLLPETWNIYAVTAANATESSYATYCPEYDQGFDEKIDTCLGDLFSVAWMEDTEKHDRTNEDLAQQFDAVKERAKGEYYGGN